MWCVGANGTTCDRAICAIKCHSCTTPQAGLTAIRPINRLAQCLRLWVPCPRVLVGKSMWLTRLFLLFCQSSEVVSGSCGALSSRWWWEWIIEWQYKKEKKKRNKKAVFAFCVAMAISCVTTYWVGPVCVCYKYKLNSIKPVLFTLLFFFAEKAIFNWPVCARVQPYFLCSRLPPAPPIGWLCVKVTFPYIFLGVLIFWLVEKVHVLHIYAHFSLLFCLYRWGLLIGRFLSACV